MKKIEINKSIFEPVMIDVQLPVEVYSYILNSLKGQKRKNGRNYRIDYDYMLSHLKNISADDQKQVDEYRHDKYKEKSTFTEDLIT